MGSPEGRTTSEEASRPRAERRAAHPRLAVGLPAARLSRRGAAREARPAPRRRPAAARSRRRADRARRRTPGAGGAGRAAAGLVETFDTRRRTNLFLTYFVHGDTRKRGLALLRFKQTYLRSGFVLDAGEATGGELPDHLCVVLEYAATVDRRLGWRLLLDHRAGLELLRLALLDDASPWAGAVEAVCATLPPLRGEEMAAVQRLAAEGPPAEEVGLTPYGTPAFDAAPRRREEPGHEHLPVGRLPLRLRDLLRARPHLALPIRQVRLDHALLPALRGTPAALGKPAVPLRPALRLPRARDGPRGTAVVDVGGRCHRGDVPRDGDLHRLGRRLLHPGRDGHPDLPPAHRRSGLQRDDEDGQVHVRRARRR